MKLLRISLIAAGLSLAATSSGFAQGDPAKGETVFKKCSTCHRVGDGAKNGVGPVLNGVIGRTAGTAEGFSYSALNKSSGEAGLVWSEDKIIEYLNDPNAFLKKFLTEKGKANLATGATKMVFKLAPEGERRDVAAYVAKFSPPKP